MLLRFVLYTHPLLTPGMLTVVVDFKIYGAANLTGRPPRPSFTAHCAGQGEGAPYRFCQRVDQEDNDAVVVAKLLPGNNSTTNGTRQATIQVSLKHTDLDNP
jgi:hypothetical protein